MPQQPRRSRQPMLRSSPCRRCRGCRARRCRRSSKGPRRCCPRRTGASRPWVHAHDAVSGIPLMQQGMPRMQAQRPARVLRGDRSPSRRWWCSQVEGGSLHRPRPSAASCSCHRRHRWRSSALLLPRHGAARRRRRSRRRLESAAPPARPRRPPPRATTSAVHGFHGGGHDLLPGRDAGRQGAPRRRPPRTAPRPLAQGAGCRSRGGLRRGHHSLRARLRLGEDRRQGPRHDRRRTPRRRQEPQQLAVGPHTIAVGKATYLAQTKRVTLKSGQKVKETFYMTKPGAVAVPKPCGKFLERCPN